MQTHTLGAATDDVLKGEDIYLRYDLEDVAFRYDAKAQRWYLRFYGEAQEHEVPYANTLLDNVRHWGTSIDRETYYSV